MTAGWSRSVPQSGQIVRVSQLRDMRGREQVAAVCYRIGDRGIEFLLVRTRGGRWTFPKGSAEPGLTHAQAAALEAFEEAGVHGRMEETSFARYVRGKRRGARQAETFCGTADIAVHAHLCEVTRLSRPQEANRNPKWFSAEKAKLRLAGDRPPDYGAEIAALIDRAVNRIQRIQSASRTLPDALQKVRFEAFEGTALYARMEQASFAHLVRRQRDDMPYSAVAELAVNAHLCKILQLSPVDADPRYISSGKPSRRLLLGVTQNERPSPTVEGSLIPVRRLPSGSSVTLEARRKVQCIESDARRRKAKSKVLRSRPGNGPGR